MNHTEDQGCGKRPDGLGGGSIVGRLWLVMMMTCALLMTAVSAAEPENEPKSIRKMCGSCPDGYATTAVTSAPELCKDGESTLVQCVPLGANMLAVCGECPGGYREIGRSNVVARCGQRAGGLLAQCQQQQMESTLPDPTKGGVVCPPDCGSTGTAGEGAGTPPPKFRPAPSSK
ncbi:hypothetical protein [Nitrospira sp. Nam80]